MLLWTFCCFFFFYHQHILSLSPRTGCAILVLNAKLKCGAPCSKSIKNLRQHWWSMKPSAGPFCGGDPVGCRGLRAVKLALPSWPTNFYLGPALWKSLSFLRRGRLFCNDSMCFCLKRRQRLWENCWENGPLGIFCFLYTWSVMT